MNKVLREEWGFRGMVITDFFRNNGHGFMNADIALPNGIDAMLATYAGGPNYVTDTTHPTNVKAMQTASKNILYTVSNSWAYEDGQIDNGILPWKKVAIFIDIILGIVLLATSIMIYKRSRRMN